MLDPTVNPSDTRSMPALSGARREAPAAPLALSAAATESIHGISFVRRLPAHRLAQRWQVRRTSEPGAMLAYRLDRARSRCGSALERAISFRHLHALPVESVPADDTQAVWLVAPFPGSYDGLLSLSGLLSRKPAGQLGPWEAAHAIDHLLSVLQSAREHGTAHGEVRLDEVLVDRGARLRLELCGVESSLRGVQPTVSEELACVARIALELLTGVPGTSSTNAVRVRGRAGRAWTRWLEGVSTLESCVRARELLPK